MGRVLLAMVLVLGIIYIVPIVVYGLFAMKAGLAVPEHASPARFLASLLVSKVGTAVAFVLLFHLGSGFLEHRWILYASIWWLMFVTDEVGQALGAKYSWKEAAAGILSESVYFPLAAFVMQSVIS